MRAVPLALVALVLAGCAGPAPPPPPGPPAPAAPPSTAVALRWAAPHDFGLWGYEPGIAVDHLGTLYITAHKVLDRPETWKTLDSMFLLSRDDGATWGPAASPAPAGGGPLPALYQLYVGDEGDIAVDARGWVYFLDTYLADNHLHAWSDQGRTWEYSEPAMRTVGADDRPWLTAQGDGILHYLGNNGNPVNGGRHWYYRSADAGLTWTTGLPMPGNGWAHLDAERGGQNVYVVQEYDPVNANAPGPQRAIVSRDGGQRFEAPVTMVERAGYGRGYPVVSAGDAGVAWVVVNDCGTAANCADAGGAQQPNLLLLAGTTDAGASWRAWNLTLPPGVFADYPWVAAGPNGTVAVAFYGAATPVTQDSEWFLYAAMARPGLNATPELRFEKAVPGVLYKGADLHALHDFFEIAIGPDEALHVAYMNAEDTTDPIHDYGERFIHYVQARQS